MTTFSLWGPYATAAAATCNSGGGETAVRTATTSTYTKSGGGTGTGTWSGTGTATVSSAGLTFGFYYWTASFAGDNNNAPASEGCQGTNELLTVSRVTPGGSTTIRIGDSVTVTGATPTGTASFFLYKDDATCAVVGSLVYSETLVGLTGGAASTASEYTATAAGTYRWLVTYSGDANNSPATVSNCVEVATITYPA